MFISYLKKANNFINIEPLNDYYHVKILLNIINSKRTSFFTQKKDNLMVLYVFLIKNHMKEDI